MDLASFRPLLAVVLAAGVLSTEGVRAQDANAPDVRTAGHGEPEIIFLPEPGAPGAEWDHVVARFEVGYRCHVFTPTPRTDRSLGEAAGAVVAYVRAQGLVRPVLVGHGLGGVLALTVALQVPELPGRLVLVDSLPFSRVVAAGFSAADLRRVRCPALVLGALAGPATPGRGVYRRQYRDLPGVRFAFFRTGHFLMVDDLDGFTDALRRELLAGRHGVP